MPRAEGFTIVPTPFKVVSAPDATTRDIDTDTDPPRIPPAGESKPCPGAVDITTPIRAYHPALASREKLSDRGDLK